MSENKNLLRESFEAGMRFGEDKSLSPREAVAQTMEFVHQNFATAAGYAERRKARKKAVAERLQQLRKDCDLKQQEAAEKTGLNVVTLSGYEIGKNEPNMEALVQLADAYGVTLDYLMCRTDDEELKQYKGK